MNPSPASTGKVPTVRDVSGLLIIGCLFTAAGGYMDAYSYLAHGHVFANAQTGNVVFFSVFASAGRWDEALRHLPPIAAFALGVAIAKLLVPISSDLYQIWQDFQRTVTAESSGIT